MASDPGEGKGEKSSISDLFTATVQRAFGREALLLGGFTLVVIVAVLYGTSALGQTIKSGVDAGIERVEEKRAVDRAAAEATAEALKRHLAEDAENRLQQAQMNRVLIQRLDENAADTRALYKAVITGEKQMRLERPPQPLDGGPPFKP